MIELINVSKKYVTKAGDTVALNNVNLKLDDTGLVFIIGKSGCGKTTLLNMIGGLDSLDSGDIIVDGKKFSEFTAGDYDSYRNTLVGFVFQEYNLLSDYNIEKNIDIANELQGKKAKEEDIEKLLRTVEIGGYEKRRPYQLSGGQKQRASIARALIKNPKIVLADEPTGALDSATGIQVMDLLKELSKDKLIIIVSHEQEFAEKYADRIIRLVDGQVVEDVTQKEVELKEVIHEFEDEVVVKAGSDLSDSDTKVLAKAIKENKKINITDKIFVKQKEKTKEKKIDEQKEPVKFIHSKMKLKSVAGLGLKSLFSKPIRLIFTILLSMIAFAVFGVFDAVGSFNDERGLISLLEGENYKTVAIYGQYNNYGYNNADFKLSQAQLNSLNNQTNYSFRGIYDIKDQTEFSAGNKTRENFNKEHAINDSNVSGHISKGEYYYYKEFDGIIEFKQSEIVENVIMPNEFNYRIIYGEYPELKTEDEQYQSVGISSFMARNILFWMNTNNSTEFGKKKNIKDIKDLIGAELRISTTNTKTFIIKAIIDCGEIPAKYNKLKEATEDTMYALSQDFVTFINAGSYLSLFLPDGYVQGLRQTNNRKTVYFGEYSSVDYFGTQPGADASLPKKVNANPYYYNINEFDQTDVILFEDVENDIVTTGEITLKNNEALVSVNNLLLLFDAELDKSSNKTYLTNLIKSIIAEKAPDAKRELTKEFLLQMKNVYNQDYKYSDYTKYVKLTGEKGEQTVLTKTLFIKGFYFNVNTDFASSQPKTSIYDPFVLSSAGLSALGVSTNQGIYSRAITVLKDSANAQLLGEMMVDTDGFGVRWYKNTMIDSLAENSEFLDQLLQLFLYVSLVIILFSMFMLMNYITSSIASKRHTIGILRALGAKGKNIFIMFLFESMIIALINGILASIVGYVASSFVNAYILDVMNMTISFALFGIRQVLIMIGVSVATGFVSSLLPIIKIVKEKPVALIRKNS